MSPQAKPPAGVVKVTTPSFARNPPAANQPLSVKLISTPASISCKAIKQKISLDPSVSTEMI